MIHCATTYVVAKCNYWVIHWGPPMLHYWARTIEVTELTTSFAHRGTLIVSHYNRNSTTSLRPPLLEWLLGVASGTHQHGDAERGDQRGGVETQP
jgi:hypothetical protein